MHRDVTTLIRVVGEATSGLGALLLEYKSPAAALAAPDERLAELPPATQAALKRAQTSRNRPPGISSTPTTTSLSGAAQILAITDDTYPTALRAIPDPPPWIFLEGDAVCLAQPAVAIVGSRRASRAGRDLATKLASFLAGRGYLVCSGLALGIDAAAHNGALETGRTAAVLASGLDRPSPAANLGLAGRIREAGCLLSELPYGTSPNRARFPRRNRIISGLCQATIVVEAALPSGTLHTAQAAAEQGRDVFVLPWSLLHPGGRGCLRLLRDGAVPITDLDDLIDLFPDVGNASSRKGEARFPECQGAAGAEPDAMEQLVLDTLGDACLSYEDFQALLPVTPAELSQCLTGLEIQGRINRQGSAFVLACDSGSRSGKP